MKNTPVPSANTITKPKRFRSDTNLLQTNDASAATPTFPFLPPSPFPLWPFNLYHPSYLPAMMNAIRLSAMSQANLAPMVEVKPSKKVNRKSFEIEGILNLSLRDNKRKTLSETLSSEEDDSNWSFLSALPCLSSHSFCLVVFSLLNEQKEIKKEFTLEHVPVESMRRVRRRSSIETIDRWEKEG